MSNCFLFGSLRLLLDGICGSIKSSKGARRMAEVSCFSDFVSQPENDFPWWRGVIGEWHCRFPVDTPELPNVEYQTSAPRRQQPHNLTGVETPLNHTRSRFLKMFLLRPSALGGSMPDFWAVPW